METTQRLRIEAVVIYNDAERPLSISMANLFEEFAYWIKDVGPLALNEKGSIGLPSGSVKWRTLE